MDYISLDDPHILYLIHYSITRYVVSFIVRALDFYVTGFHCV